MKFAIIVLLAYFFWQAPGARRAAAVMLRDVANFVQPEPTTMQDKINQFKLAFNEKQHSNISRATLR